MKKVIVLGDVILDKTTHVTVKGISPESDHVLAVRPKRVTYNLGGAANVAAGIKALGGDPLLLTMCSSDWAAGQVRELLSKGHADVPYEMDYWHGGHTTLKERIVTHTGQLLRLDVEEPGVVPSDYWHAGKLMLRLAHELFDHKDCPDPVVCFVDYDKGMLDDKTVGRLMEILRRHKPDTPVLVDPGRHGNWHRFSSPVTTFKANLRQCLAHYHRNRADWPEDLQLPLDPRWEIGVDDTYPHDVYLKALRAVKHNLVHLGTEFKYLVITLGAGGVGFVPMEGEPVRFVGEPVQVTDPCGAGDTVMATLAAMLAHREEYTVDRMKMACAAAHAAASKAVTKRGVYVVKREEVEISAWTLLGLTSPAPTSSPVGETSGSST